MKYWRKRLFILTSKDLRYYESGEPRARGSIELRDIKRVHAVHARGQFDVDTASGRVYQLMALSDRERAQWMSAINDAQFSPTPLARLLRVVEDLEVAGHIDSDVRSLPRRHAEPATPAKPGDPFTGPKNVRAEASGLCRRQQRTGRVGGWAAAHQRRGRGG